MNKSQQQIAHMKDFQRTGFHQLQKQGDMIERELEIFEERTNSAIWDGAGGDAAAHRPQQAPIQPQVRPLTTCAKLTSVGTHNSRNSTSYKLQERSHGLLPEVVEYETFEEEHGVSGNWHPEDHAEFMRILKDTKHDYAATLAQCSESMIGFDRLDIIAHAQWHSKHIELGLRKKLAIQQWQQQRSHVAQTEKALAADMVSEGAQVPKGSTKKRCCALRILWNCNCLQNSAC